MTAHEPAPASWSTPREALGLFLRGATVRTGVRVALVVGTVLSLVNQGQTIANGSATVGTWVRVAVNYMVPFLVSSYGFLAGCRDATRA
ncbi:MAG: nitrate/nitrite transporter NrtS [Acidimicrobiia bacterium]|jgi:mannose/fructose/N-acetylgalactosamine-specific phosphotransferase system component IIC